MVSADDSHIQKVAANCYDVDQHELDLVASLLASNDATIGDLDIKALEDAVDFASAVERMISENPVQSPYLAEACLEQEVEL